MGSAPGEAGVRADTLLAIGGPEGQVFIVPPSIRKVGGDKTTRVREGPVQELVPWGCTQESVGIGLISLSQHPCSSEKRGEGQERVDEGTLGDCSHPSGDDGRWVTRCWRGRWNNVDRGCFVHRITR